MNKVTRITQEVKNNVIHYFQNRKAMGLNQKKIASMLCISERSVKRILDEAGLATAVPLLKGEARSALSVLHAWSLSPASLNGVLKDLEDAGILATEEGKITATARPAPTPAQIIKAMAEMEPEQYAETLSKIVEARVAHKYNVGVQTAMLNISNAVDKNAKR